MKHFGILTFHFSDNYGAVLQCYALRKVINSLDECCADVIPFNPGRKVGWYDDEVLQGQYKKKLEIFRTFNYEETGILKKDFGDICEILNEKYDGYIVGSDQVWNVSFSFFDTSYLLDFANEDKLKISYAASVGLDPAHPRMRKSIFEKHIPRFDYISVREKTHESFIAQFTDKKVETVLDPTLLLTAKDYDCLIEDVNKNEENFLFFYYLKHDSTTPLACSFVNMLSRKYNLKIIHFYVEMPEQTFKNENRSFYFEGPKDFIWYIKHAKIVVTNSFHGTVFSILYHKPFYTYIVKSMQARVLDLLGDLGLENRLIRGHKPLNEVDYEINYENVDILLEKKRRESLRFLRKAVGVDDE